MITRRLGIPATNIGKIWSDVAGANPAFVLISESNLTVERGDGIEDRGPPETEP